MLVLRKLVDRLGLDKLFLFFVLGVWVVVGFFDIKDFLGIGKIFIDMLLKVAVSLVFVFLLMFIVNILLSKEGIKSFIKEFSHTGKYFAMLIGGIISVGSAGSWFPFLKQLQEHGFTYGQIATFLYARAVKLPFLAVMIQLFGLKYTIIFNIFLIIGAVLVGVIMDLILSKN